MKLLISKIAAMREDQQKAEMERAPGRTELAGRRLDQGDMRRHMTALSRVGVPYDAGAIEAAWGDQSVEQAAEMARLSSVSTLSRR